MAENHMQTALKSIFAVAEAYPQLQASQNFLQLQGELVDTEDKIQASRRFYNGGVRELNTKIKVFPNTLFVRAWAFPSATSSRWRTPRPSQSRRACSSSVPRSMYSAIARNKRNTVFIILLFLVIIGGLAWLASIVYGGPNGDPTIVIVVIVVATIYAIVQYFAASRLAVSMAGGHEIRKSDNPRLYRIVENLAITTGLPTPKIYIVDDPSPNAFATGRDPKPPAWPSRPACSTSWTTRNSRPSWPTRWATCRTTTSASP